MVQDISEFVLLHYYETVSQSDLIYFSSEPEPETHSKHKNHIKQYTTPLPVTPSPIKSM